jgi:hypothetical protein
MPIPKIGQKTNKAKENKALSKIWRLKKELP